MTFGLSLTAKGLTKQKFDELRAKGLSYERIAKMFSVSHETLKAWRIYHGYPVGKYPGRKTISLSIEKYEEYKQEGYADKEIAEYILNCTSRELSDWKKRNQITSYGQILFTQEQYEEQKKQGKKEKEIMKIFGFKNPGSYYAHKRRIGITKKKRPDSRSWKEGVS
ncbi:hypothetical protein RY280_23510 [Bacillus paralicheniformis]|uniref:hypothetical protein n=1 Tax=Bacillus paralicheniformis TaxID=1648923 RepID=UPI00203A8143|nr:hypothetical protein [Bacillus paralicheniformis]MCM3425592.1 hypothetical protein [Bacillus paralicheniformis]